jgi:hypothetical protein
MHGKLKEDNVSYLVVEAASSSETSVIFYQATWRNNPEDSGSFYSPP